MPDLVEFPAIRAAMQRIEALGLAHRSPVLTSSSLDQLASEAVGADRELFFKADHLQKGGAFKIRGASSFVGNLSPPLPPALVTHSSGNHAQAVALTASARGIPAHIVMPAGASAVKRRAVEAYGATVVTCERTEESRRQTCARVLKETGGVFMPPFDHPDIVAGAGTVAVELLEDVSDLDAIVAPVGGGGLLSGIAVATAGLAPGCRVYGAEPVGADDAARSMAEGERLPQEAPDTIADGLLTGLGELNFALLRKHEVEIKTVSDADIVAAMRLVWERMKQLIEPSAAVAVAVALGTAIPAQHRRVGVILSGGNLDLDQIPWLGPGAQPRVVS